MFRRRAFPCVRVLCTAAMGVLASCCTINPGDPNTPTAQKVKVRVVNLSMFGVDPQLYATSAAVVDPNADLFVDANRKLASVNYGTGIIPPLGNESLDLDCAAARVVATRGGRFLQENATLVGTGAQRILSQDTTFSCGQTITFTFRGSSAGNLETSVGAQ